MVGLVRMERDIKRRNKKKINRVENEQEKKCKMNRNTNLGTKLLRNKKGRNRKKLIGRKKRIGKRKKGD
jgi:hypothetical protein